MDPVDNSRELDGWTRTKESFALRSQFECKAGLRLDVIGGMMINRMGNVDEKRNDEETYGVLQLCLN